MLTTLFADWKRGAGATVCESPATLGAAMEERLEKAGLLATAKG